MPLDPVETLQKLIRTPSVNPMGRDVVGPIYGESRMTQLLTEICQQQGWHWYHQPVHSGRSNLLAVVEGTPPPQEGGELMVWDVHQDTVPVDGMTIDPFAAELRDGKVYGRGACDVKGSMAAMLAALSRLPRSFNERPTIVLACTVNEECGFTGAQMLTQGWSTPAGESDEVSTATDAKALAICRLRPQAVIVAEPTNLDVVVAHQGVVRWRCHTIGRSAHTSRPDTGINAIYAMAQIVQAIEQYHAQLQQTSTAHPLCGRPSVCVSTIHGGVGVNTVPERATIEIDRRLAPDEQPEAAYQQLVSFVAQRANVGRCRVEHDPPFMQSGGLGDKQNRHLAQRLSTLVDEFGRHSKLIGVPYATDASAIAATGVPTVVFGPGSIDQAHTSDEFIATDELQLATEIFYRIASESP